MIARFGVKKSEILERGVRVQICFYLGRSGGRDDLPEEKNTLSRFINLNTSTTPGLISKTRDGPVRLEE